MTEVADATVLSCGCCGEPRPPDDVVRLTCHPDVAVCGQCVDWMAAKVRARPKVTPIFPVRDMAEATAFWASAGVEVEAYDEGYAFVLAGGAEVVHLALVPGLDPAANATACYVHVGDPDVWHERWKAADLPVTELRLEPWGMREFSLTDPSGNLVRVGCNA